MLMIGIELLTLCMFVTVGVNMDSYIGSWRYLRRLSLSCQRKEVPPTM